MYATGIGGQNGIFNDRTVDIGRQHWTTNTSCLYHRTDDLATRLAVQKAPCVFVNINMRLSLINNMLYDCLTLFSKYFIIYF